MQQDNLGSGTILTVAPARRAKPSGVARFFMLGVRVTDLSPGNLTKYERGMWAEAVAIKWLECLRYHVFLNVKGAGPYDLVAFKDGEFTGIDVKLVTIRIRNGRMTFADRSGRKSDAQQGLDVKFLYVTEEGICSFNRADLCNKERMKRGMDKGVSRCGRPRKELAALLALAPLQSLQ